MVIDYLVSVAQEVRETLARLGFRALNEIIGRSELLTEKTSGELPRGGKLALLPIVARTDVTDDRPRHYTQQWMSREEDSLNERVYRTAARAIAKAKQIALSFKIRNTHRAIGARVAGEIAYRHGDRGLTDGTIDLTFSGTAGQSFGAFTVSGMRLTLIGEANDYVGKGMSGGEIIIRPPDEAAYVWSQNVIIGNTVLYGAIGGGLFAAGRAGERFAVRNSGATAVVEGVGDHGCEYMTAGAVVVLGEVGRNFAAGMTGGVAYALDLNENFKRHCNHELVTIDTVGVSDEQELRRLIERHLELTGSLRARDVLWHWDHYRRLFWKVVTQGATAAPASAEPEEIVITEAMPLASASH